MNKQITPWQERFTGGMAVAFNDQVKAMQAEIDELRAALAAQPEQAKSVAYGDIAQRRDQLQARLDAMGKGEPIYQYLMGDGSWIDQAKQSYDYNRNHAPHAVMRIVYAAPKALAPLTDEQLFENDDLLTINAHHIGDFNIVRKIAKAIEAAHGIGGTP